eukprot:2964696-Amphidinium_carterae.1
MGDACAGTCAAAGCCCTWWRHELRDHPVCKCGPSCCPWIRQVHCLETMRQAVEQCASGGPKCHLPRYAMEALQLVEENQRQVLPCCYSCWHG